MSSSAIDTGLPKKGRIGKKSTFRPDIQGLRTLAVAAVIADHLFGFPLGGFVGVDVFFVISGYLITGIILREYEKTGRISFTRFYRRRIRRILPLATVVIVATVVASYILLTRTRSQAVAVDGVWAFFSAANWHMALVGTDYFQLGLPPSPLQHYWSLSVEEQFYLVWPWLLLGFLLIAGRLGWKAEAKRKTVIAIFAFATLASFAWSVHESATNANLSYFSTLDRAWELGIGAIVASLAAYLTRLPAWLRPGLAWAGLIGIITSLFLIGPTTQFPGPGALLPVLSTALVIAAGTGRRNRTYDWALFPITNRIATYFGNISYSLYLWHFPVAILLIAIFPSDSAAYLIVGVVSMIGLSVLSYHLIEDPIRNSRWLDPRRLQGDKTTSPRAAMTRLPRRVLIGVGLSTLIFGTAGIFFLNALTDDVAAGAANSHLGQSANAEGANLTMCFGAAAMDPTLQPCRNPALEGTITPSIDQLSDDAGGAYACWIGKGQSLKSCTVGSQKANALRVALVGDSHAAMLLPALKPQLVGLNWRLDVFTGYGCQWRANTSVDCVETMNKIQSRLSSDSEPYDIVITTSARWTAGPDKKKASSDYAEFWMPVSKLGTKVIAIADNPAVSGEALECLSRIGFDPSVNDCATPERIAFADIDPLLLAVELVPGAHVVDLQDFYCSNGTCPAVIGHVIAYRDTADHITGTFSRTLSPYLTASILEALEP